MNTVEKIIEDNGELARTIIKAGLRMNHKSALLASALVLSDIAEKHFGMSKEKFIQEMYEQIKDDSDFTFDF